MDDSQSSSQIDTRSEPPPWRSGRRHLSEIAAEELDKVAEEYSNALYRNTLEFARRDESETVQRKHVKQAVSLLAGERINDDAPSRTEFRAEIFGTFVAFGSALLGNSIEPMYLWVLEGQPIPPTSVLMFSFGLWLLTTSAWDAYQFRRQRLQENKQNNQSETKEDDNDIRNEIAYLREEVERLQDKEPDNISSQNILGSDLNTRNSDSTGKQYL